MISIFPRLLRSLVGLVFGLALAACSSLGPVGTGPTVPTAPSGPTPAGPTSIATAQYGTGALKVALVTHDQTDDLADGGADSTFLAAKLASGIVAKSPITLLVYRYDGSPANLQAIEDDAAKQQVSLVIAPDDDAATQKLATTFGRKGTTVISLGGLSAPDVHLFAFGMSGSVEASLTADEMRRRLYRSIVLVSNPAGTAKVFASQLASAATSIGITVIPVDARDASGAATRITSMVNSGQIPGAVVFLESPSASSSLLKKLRANQMLANVAVIGTSAWGFNAGAAGTLGPGWYLAPDSSTIGSFSQRFSSAYGKASTPDGALAYDLIVLATALPQLFPGNAPYSPEILTNSQGFVGVTGKFWFTADGQAHRNLLAVDLPATRPQP